MRILTTIKEIKDAVDAGRTVYSGTNAYRVIKDRLGQYLIYCDLNAYCIMLHGREGTEYENELNGNKFYIL